MKETTKIGLFLIGSGLLAVFLSDSELTSSIMRSLLEKGIKQDGKKGKGQ